MPVKIYSVSELSGLIKDLLESNFYGIWVEGEISSLRYSSTGHLYFSLVDDRAAIGAIVYKSRVGRLGFEPKNGMKVVVFGHLSLYLKGGEYRIAVEYAKPAGTGRRFYDLERLKEEFKRKGYFDRKRPIPAYPKRIIVVTSPTGAAIRDIINIVRRRAFELTLFIYPVSVQGEEARFSILKALREINTLSEKIDAVVLARGGGSNEDLWLFNDPEIAKALYDVKFPTISAIGHEIDFTLCDFVADLRAETPSAAAEILTESRQQLRVRLLRIYSALKLSMKRVFAAKSDKLERFSARRLYIRITGFVENRMMYLDVLTEKITAAVNRCISMRIRRLDGVSNRLSLNSPVNRLNMMGEKIRLIRENMIRDAGALLNRKESELKLISSRIRASSPVEILKKGYSITLDSKGKAITDAGEVKAKESIITLLYRGKIVSTVEKTLTKEEKQAQAP